MRKLLVPGCYKVLDKRIKCGIAVASYTEIEEQKIKPGKFAGEPGVKAGIHALNSFEKKRDWADLRREVDSQSIECACALYGGIVFMLDNEILSVYNDLPEGYGLVIFGEGREHGENMECNALIELIRLALSLELKKFSEVLAKTRNETGFWEERKKILAQSIFWGTGEDGKAFAVMPLGQSLEPENSEIVEIDIAGLRMVNEDD